MQYSRFVRLLPLLLYLLSAAFSISIKANQQQTQVVELLFDKDYAPASYVSEDGSLKGFHQQILKLIHDELQGYSLAFKPVDWRTALKQIESGDAVGVVGPFFLGDLRPYMHPYSRPLYNEKVIVICNPGVELAEPVIWPTSFANKLMLNVQGFDGWLDNEARHRRFTALMNFLEVPNITVAAQMVSKGNADCSLYEELALAYTRQNAGPETSLNVIQVAHITEQPIHVGYSFAALQKAENAHLQDFIRQFDFAVYKLQQEGKIEQVLTKFKQNISAD